MKKTKQKLTGFIFWIFLFASAGYSQSFENNFLTVNIGTTSMARPTAELDTAFKILTTELGCTYTKLSFNWGIIEPQQGNFQWEQHDSLVAIVQNYDVDIVAFFPQSNTPLWAKKPGSNAGVPNNPQNFANYIHQVLNRYKTSMNIKYVEILNEISNGVGDGINTFTAHWDTTATYAAKIVTTVHDTVKKYFPDVLIGSASFTQPHPLRDNMTAQDTVKDAYMNAYFSANPQFDFLPLHDYPHYAPTQTGDFKYSTQYNFTNLYRDLLDMYGYNDKTIMITEGALGTKNGVDDSLYAAFYSQDCIITYSKKDSINLIGKIKSSLANGMSGTTGFNIVNVSTGEYYPAYYSFKNVKSIIEKYPNYQGRIAGQVDDLNYWVLHFMDNDSNELYTAFTPIQIYYPNPEQSTPREFNYSEPQIAQIQIGQNKQALITQLYGDTTTVYSDINGYISFNVYKETVFIEIQSSETSINEINLTNENIKIYPNPTSGIFTIKGENIQSIEITNIYGQVIYSSDAIKLSDKYKVDLSEQPRGIYFIKIQSDNLIQTKKIVIQ